MNPQPLTPLHLSPPPNQVCVSDFCRGSSSFTLALLQQLSGWFHSDAAQTPLIVFFVISSCFLTSLTSTPTHLQNRYQLQLCSHFSLALAFSTLSPLWLFGQIDANTGSALIWLWVDFGSDFILTLSQLSTSSGFDSPLLLDLKLKFSAQSHMSARLYFCSACLTLKKPIKSRNCVTDLIFWGSPILIDDQIHVTRCCTCKNLKALHQFGGLSLSGFLLGLSHAPIFPRQINLNWPILQPGKPKGVPSGWSPKTLHGSHSNMLIKL